MISLDHILNCNVSSGLDLTSKTKSCEADDVPKQHTKHPADDVPKQHTKHPDLTGSPGTHICEVCNKEFRYLSALQRHFRTHTGMYSRIHIHCYFR